KTISTQKIRANGCLTAQVAVEEQGELSGGFDRLIYLPALGKTLAQLPAKARAQYSHRGRAVADLVRQLY
ncbi:MAG: non-canonical purine NTP pyrophosphatase, partial [Loigolactobacillus coryniformis]|nr:non-canonical purine NTP pyrophosphatase [Loigolactobacillus coryniformis]